MMEIESDDIQMQKLIKALQKSNYVIRVGVLGDNAERDSEDEDRSYNNAQIGAVHEFGIGVPQRSFLRMPLNKYFYSKLKSSGGTEEAFKIAILKGDFHIFVMQMAVVAEGVVIESFLSGGYGDWPISNMKYKKTKKTLIETRQLMRSITSDVINTKEDEGE